MAVFLAVFARGRNAQKINAPREATTHVQP